MEKKYISPNELYLYSYLLAKKIEEDTSFFPHLLVGLWRGGTPIAITIHEYLKHKKNSDLYHFPIKAENYLSIGSGNHTAVKTYHVTNMFNDFPKCKNILFVDDIFDTGKTLEHLIKEITNLRDFNIKIATLLYKPSKNKTIIKPNYYLFETNEWIIFPHELDGIDNSISNQNRFFSGFSLTHKDILNLNFSELNSFVENLNLNKFN